MKTSRNGRLPWAAFWGLGLILAGTSLATDRFPTAAEPAPREKLADPFRFLGSDRRVQTKEDSEECRTEMRRLIQHDTCGPGFPKTYNAFMMKDERV